MFMNARIKFVGLLCFICLFALVSCKKEEDSNPGNLSPSQLEAYVEDGAWSITKFIDSGTDETNDFAGYAFSFNNNGVVIANNGTNSFFGNWIIFDSNSDDDSEDDLNFNITFNLPNDFEDLSDDWDFVSYSATKIELIDESGGNGDADYLTFEKN